MCVHPCTDYSTYTPGGKSIHGISASRARLSRSPNAPRSRHRRAADTHQQFCRPAGRRSTRPSRQSAIRSCGRMASPLCGEGGVAVDLSTLLAFNAPLGPHTLPCLSQAAATLVRYMHVTPTTKCSVLWSSTQCSSGIDLKD
ncbi:hypothetical protein L209DRAFT_71841 [Thermothelomyces heterothallicus CBS 203.75]